MSDVLSLTAAAVDLSRGEVRRTDGTTAQLTDKELGLLRYLVERPGTDVAREALLTDVWGYSERVVSRSCDTAMQRLRTKVEADPARPDHLLTVRGVGYRFVGAARAEVAAPAPATERPRGRIIRVPRREIDLGRLEVSGPDGVQTVSALEAAIVEALYDAQGTVVSREALLRRAWPPGTGTPRAVDAAISRLRPKLEDEPSAPRALLSVRGRGYRLIAVDDEEESTTTRSAAAFFGRDAELEALGAAVEAGALTVVVGPPGIGKTRLVLEHVRTRPGAVWWADCARATSTDELGAAVARALDLPLTGDPVGQIAGALALRPPGVLVLDNLEQAVEAARAAVTHWQTDQIALLATSRVRLGIDGERAVEVGPLSADAASALLVERVRGRVDPSDVQLASLLDRLDRRPLAIELAAAHLDAVTVADLLRRIDRKLSWLAPLESALATSWDLLAPAEQQALCQLALLSGWFDLDTAEALVGPDALMLVTALRRHSLLGARGKPRQLLVAEAVRDFCAARRAELPDAGEALERRYVERYARLGVYASIRTIHHVGREDDWAELEASMDDALAAAELAAARGWHDLAARCALAGAAVVDWQGPHQRGLAVLARVRAPDDHALAHLTARLLRSVDRPADAHDLARFAASSPDPDLARDARTVLTYIAYDLALPERFAYVEDAIAAHEAAGDVGVAAWCRARLARWQGGTDLDAASLAVEEARRTGDRVFEMNALLILGMTHEGLGHFRLAVTHLSDAATTADEIGCLEIEATIHEILVRILAHVADHNAAEASLARGIALLEQLGSTVQLITILAYGGALATFRGDLDVASDRFLRARSMLRQVRPIRATEAYLCARQAELALLQGDRRSAEVLARRAHALFAELGRGFNAAICLALVGEVTRDAATCAAAVRLLRDEPTPDRIDLAVALCRWGLTDPAVAPDCLAEAEALLEAAGSGGPRTEGGNAVAALRAAMA